MSSVMTSAVADTEKYERSSMRRCFEVCVGGEWAVDAPLTPFCITLAMEGVSAEPDGKLVGGGEPALGSGGEKVPAVGAGLKIVSSDWITRSGWSRIAESTITLVIC